MNCELQDKIFSIGNAGFESLALEIFRYQYANNAIYQQFSESLHIDPLSVKTVASIPFLPVSFLKIIGWSAAPFGPEAIFESSGTTQTGNSRHLVKNVEVYRESFLRAFEMFYGDVTGWCIIGLLPSYLERQHSSLVMMVDQLIKLSKNEASGFYLYDHDQLIDTIRENEARGRKTLLIGVTFALLDLAEKFKFHLKHTVVMETGGMKGKTKRNYPSRSS